jgi:hypothetical protein
MVALLKNVQVNTARPHNSGGNTSVPTAYLTGIQGHAEFLHSGSYRPLDEGALQAHIKIKFDPGTDIVDGDVLTSILQLSDGNPWLDAANPNEILTVTYTENSTAGILPCRACYVNRDILGGPAQA